MEAAPPALDQVDLSDPDAFAGGPPHETFALLRERAPVHWNPAPEWWDPEKDGEGFWSITRAADIASISRDTETFSSWRGGTMIRDEAVVPLDIFREAMLNMDPPRHTKHRAIVQTAFTPRRVREQEGHIQELVRRIVDQVCESGECDFVRDIAVELPLQVIAEMLGVPHEERGKLFDWTGRVAGFDDPALRPDAADGLVAFGELSAYLAELVAERKRKPRDDLVTALSEAEVDGERLSDLEQAAFFGLLMVAGNETTRNTLSGGMLALMQHPGERQKLIDDPALIPGAVEEILRWVTPVMHFRRTATRDCEVRGQRIAEGDKVVMWYASANRDPELNDDPDRFDVRREEVEHRAFGGGGRHFCLGAGLARVELRITFEELLRRLPDMEPAGEVTRLRSNWLNGITAMPVRFTPAPKAG